MKRIVLLLLIICPMMASAQKFVCNLDVNLYGSPSTMTPVRGSVDKGEEVTVSNLQYNGWCSITAGEKTGYMKIKRLDPLDDVAREMKTLADDRVGKETKMVTWGIIIVLITLVLSLATKHAKKVRIPIMMAGIVLVSILEILYLANGYEFTFYSPFVLGSWLKAAMYFLAFVLFLGVQVFLWLKTLQLLAETTPKGAEKGQGGCFLSIVVLVLGFVAFAVVGLTNKEAEYNKYIFWGLVISQVIQVVIFFIYYIRTPLTALLYVITYAVGFAAVIYMAMDVIEVMICAIFIGAVLEKMFTAGTTFQITTRIGGREKTVWSDENKG